MAEQAEKSIHSSPTAKAECNCLWQAYSKSDLFCPSQMCSSNFEATPESTVRSALSVEVQEEVKDEDEDVDVEIQGNNKFQPNFIKSEVKTEERNHDLVTAISKIEVKIESSDGSTSSRR